MADVTYIIPLKEYNENVEPLLKRAIQSVEEIDGDKKIAVVGDNATINAVKPLLNDNVDLIYNEAETDFCSQINTAVMFCKTAFFSVVEYDDIVLSYWQKEALKYYKPKTGVLLPITELIDGKEKERKVLGYVNEIGWNPTFSNEKEHELGYIAMDELNGFIDYNLSGAIIKTEDFISFGGLKKSLKLASWYEFLLRIVHNGKEVFVVPKVGYSHTVNREGSYTELLRATITPDEVKWLIDTAKQEYFFKEDRNKIFENKA